MEGLRKKAYEIRRDLIEMVHNSTAGHVGGDPSVANILTVLYFRIMNVPPDKQDDPDRDRFILSKGHCADALYCVPGGKGYLNKEEAIKTFSQYRSRYIGHPNTDVPGIGMSSGSLGHGISAGVGMVLAAEMDQRPYRIYIVVGDGELDEGSNYEGTMAASHCKLDNLYATIDLNRLQTSGTTNDVMCSYSSSGKFKVSGFHVIEVEDGNDCEQLVEAYEAAASYRGKPTAVIAHTVRGKGILYTENDVPQHHGVMMGKQYQKAVQELEELMP